MAHCNNFQSHQAAVFRKKALFAKQQIAGRQIINTVENAVQHNFPQESVETKHSTEGK